MVAFRGTGFAIVPGVLITCWHCARGDPQTLVGVQQALKRAGFDPGREDGRIDDRTMNAVRSFQQAKNLPVDNERYINMATVKALGVTP